LTHYPYTNLSKLSYRFTTDGAITYKAYFSDASLMFEEFPEFANCIYTFNLDVAEGRVTEKAVDVRIAMTVNAIFREFFINKQNAVIYICDISDDRETVRKRKFDLWFWKFNDGTLLKEDGLAVISDNLVYNSLIIHKENTYLEAIVREFHSLNEKINDTDIAEVKDGI